MRAPLLTLLTLAGLAFAAQDEAQRKGPEVGKPAPAIRLNDHTGRAVSLAGGGEHWSVLAFFPKAATPG